MTNEEFQKLVIQQLAELTKGQSEIRQFVAHIENEHIVKIGAIYDGFQLRGDQIEKLQEHLDERLDTIQTDLSYVVSKVAQHERNFIKLNNRKAK